MNTITRRNFFFILSTLYYLLAALFLTSCAATYSKKSDPTQIPSLEPAALLKFQDLPIPSGFIYLPEQSYAFQSANFRAGLLKYQGKATGDQVTVFFKEQMPMYNWHLINIVEHARRMLSFEKDQETCVITLDEKGSRSEITLSVAPKSQATIRRSDKPIK